MYFYMGYKCFFQYHLFQHQVISPVDVYPQGQKIKKHSSRIRAAAVQTTLTHGNLECYHVSGDHED